MTPVSQQLLLLCLFLSTTWGIYLVATIQMWQQARAGRRSKEIVVGFRRMVVALNLWLIPFSLLFRTFMVSIGLGEQAVGQIVFFALLGTNVVGSLFALVSLRYD